MTIVSTKRIWIENIHPEVNCGRYPVKRTVGDEFEVRADIVIDGHGALCAALRHQPAGVGDWLSTPMRLSDNDRWVGRFPLRTIGRTRYTIEAWPDHFGTWLHDTELKRAAGQEIAVDLLEGVDLVAAAAARAAGALGPLLRQVLKSLGETKDVAQRFALFGSAELAAAMNDVFDPAEATQLDPPREVAVDRVGARFAAWYEMFPRSQGTVPGRSATFAECVARFPEIRELGFDVIYFVPIHPIGEAFRKGRNNAPTAEPGEPGSPYAIGGKAGGHTAIDPGLGTLEEFRALVAAARDHGMEIALDFAVQCSPDHPWIREHPEWFRFRPDGTIKYAENPPKKYQDIVNVEFYNPDAEALWLELRSVVLFWAAQGVKIFRVDNPHTKPLPFWEWLIRTVQAAHPDAIFLAEAFTRPKMMRTLAKCGFTQSYTYFTWRNTKSELTEYMTELSTEPSSDYFRPNFFPNTPDILPEFLQNGGRAGFMIRFVLAATLSPVYGIYNGFELCEAAALPGREEYANSEKYEYKVWDWDRPGHIKTLIGQVNRVRRENPALQELTSLAFLWAENDQILFFVKASADLGNLVFVAVSLDPSSAQETFIDIPWDRYGLPLDQPILLDDLLRGHSWEWVGRRQHLRLEPTSPATIFRVHPSSGEPSNQLS